MERIYASIRIKCYETRNHVFKYSKVFPLPRKTLEAFLTVAKHLAINDYYDIDGEKCKKVVTFYVPMGIDGTKLGFALLVKKLRERGIKVEVVEREPVSEVETGE